MCRYGGCIGTRGAARKGGWRLMYTRLGRRLALPIALLLSFSVLGLYVIVAQAVLPAGSVVVRKAPAAPVDHEAPLVRSVYAVYLPQEDATRLHREPALFPSVALTAASVPHYGDEPAEAPGLPAAGLLLASGVAWGALRLMRSRARR